MLNLWLTLGWAQIETYNGFGRSSAHLSYSSQCKCMYTAVLTYCACTYNIYTIYSVDCPNRLQTTHSTGHTVQSYRAHTVQATYTQYRATEHTYTVQSTQYRPHRIRPHIQYRPHSTDHTVQTTQYRPHMTDHIVQMTHDRPHRTDHTKYRPHSTDHTVQNTQYRPHMQYRPHSTDHTVQITQYRWYQYRLQWHGL